MSFNNNSRDRFNVYISPMKRRIGVHTVNSIDKLFVTLIEVRVRIRLISLTK